jgi:zinc protease
MYALSPEERIEEVRAASLEDARRCHADLVGATGADIAAVGDFDPEAFAKLVESLFGDWKNPAPYARIPSRHFEAAAMDREFRTPDKANAVLRAAQSMPMRDDHPDFAAMVLGNYLLGGSSAGRLPQRVREKEGLSYSTYSTFSANVLDASALFSVSSIYAPQNKARVEAAIREELARALKDGFGAEEVEIAKKGFLESRRVARSQDRSIAARLSYYVYFNRTFQWDIDFERAIAALTPEQVVAALRRHLDPARLSVVKAGDFR